MTDKINNGGAAFPYDIRPGWEDCSQGMSLRHYFAAAALQGFCANQKALSENVKECKAMCGNVVDMPADMPRNHLAFLCYLLADVMIKEGELQ